MSKPRRKLKLPVDRHGTPIDVGDIIAWDDEDETICKVETLTYMGDEFADTVGSWIVNIETNYYDNPQGSEVIRKAGEAMSMSAASEQIMFNEMMRVRKSGKYSPHESNYTRLFGTPERAARTLERFCSECHQHYCNGCPLCYLYDDELGRNEYDELLKWLRGEGDG